MIARVGLSDLVVEPSVRVLRVDSKPGELISTTDEVEFYSPSVNGEIEGLEEAWQSCVRSDSLGIVSLAVASAMPKDFPGSRFFCQPGTGEKDLPNRNEKGHIVSVTRLIFC